MSQNNEGKNGMNNTVLISIILGLLGVTNGGQFLRNAQQETVKSADQVAMYSNCTEELQACWAEVTACKAGR